jgi:proteasome lid subunit RPN8/RPN11
MSEDSKERNESEENRGENSEIEIENDKNLEKKQEIKSGKPVVIRAEAYKTIILYASRYANRSIPPENWKEIYGILIGYSDDEVVYIERAEALTFGHATDVQLDQKHYIFIDEIQQKLDEEGKDFYMVGWFHTHPGLNLFFSYIDIINQLGFQQNNVDFCGLVFDHTLLGKKKLEKVDGTEHTITKYDTGFEIYRITDVNMNTNDPNYDNNYHQVTYIIDGLNKYFFANVLSELSALVTEGKPLQTAYGENDIIKIKSDDHSTSQSQLELNSGDNILSEIPMEEDITFGVDDFFQQDIKSVKSQKELQIKEEAEHLIYEGNQAFNNKDAFTGIERFRQGIEKYQKIKKTEKVMDLLRTVSQKCIANDHLVFAGEFAENLIKLAKKQKDLFYVGVANYILGYLLLKKGETEVLEEGLNKIQDAAVNFENEGDFAGAGMCFNKIGSIYQSRLHKLENACLFYRAAIENYNKAIIKMHPLRTSFWNKPELLIQKIVELRDIVEELLPNLTDSELKDKIMKDLGNLQYNF